MTASRCCARRWLTRSSCWPDEDNGPPPDLWTVARPLPHALSLRSSSSSTRCSRFRSPTSAPSWRSTGCRARTISSGSRRDGRGTSLAMALNRLIDAGIDARNPRTAGRELPRGALLPWQVVALLRSPRSRSSSSPSSSWRRSFAGSGRSRSPHSSVYPYLKRVDLGLAISGSAPWTGLRRWARGRRSRTRCRRGMALGRPSRLGGRVRCLLRALRPRVDRAQGLHSLPARFGVRPRSRSPALCHLATVVFLVAAGFGPRAVGLSTGSGSPWWRHCSSTSTRSSPRGDTSRLDMAFFTMNGVISVDVLRLFVPRGRAVV